MSHTPGPWNIVRYGDGSSLVIHSDADNRVCFMATACNDRPTSHAAIRANAALIATAPELYEACAMLVEAQTGTIDGAFRLSVLNDAVTRARAAMHAVSLAKAPGMGGENDR